MPSDTPTPLPPPSPQKLSAGVLVVNEFDELLLGHVTGQPQWDIPKGCVDEGESRLEAALRELREETGIVAAPSALTDLGEFAYLPRKRLHLFLMPVQRSAIALETLKCTSMYTHKASGKRFPELDAFVWQAVKHLEERCSPRMHAALLQVGALAARIGRPG